MKLWPLLKWWWKARKDPGPWAYIVLTPGWTFNKLELTPLEGEPLVIGPKVTE